jgi:hypothetical protein
MCQTRVHARVNTDTNMCLCHNVFARDVFTYHTCRIVKRAWSSYEQFQHVTCSHTTRAVLLNVRGHNVFARDVFTYHTCRIVKRAWSSYEQFQHG